MSDEAILDGFLTLHRHCSKPNDSMPGAGLYWKGVLDQLKTDNPKVYRELMRRLEKK